MITYFGLNTREQIQNFQEMLLKSNITQKSVLDKKMSNDFLGRNFSCFVYEKNDKKLLVLIDTDDGSGGTPSDCKIVWPTFNEILTTYKPHDYLILKQQVNRDPDCNQFYPFKTDVHSIGMFATNPAKIFNISTHLKNKNLEKDIDVFFAGGLSLQHCRPYAWPKNRDIKTWWVGTGIRGYSKIKEIKEKRKDLNIQIFDGDLPQDKFFEMIHRSKICLDFPCVGKSSMKFYEYMVFESCVLSLKQQETPWSCVEDVHYSSMGDDYDFSCMENKIDFLLNNPNVRKNIENNVASIKNELTLEFIVKKAQSIIDAKIENIQTFSIEY